jgi:hypothetical protein
MFLVKTHALKAAWILLCRASIFTVFCLIQSETAPFGAVLKLARIKHYQDCDDMQHLLIA